MKTKEVNIEGVGSVTVWKMNNGFRSDLSDAAIKVNTEVKGRENIEVSMGKSRIFWQVFGIYESQVLGINKPTDLDMGLTDAEIQFRLRKVRTLSPEVSSKIYDAIVELNTADDLTDKESDALKKI